jgi:WD40 repeat protein
MAVRAGSSSAVVRRLGTVIQQRTMEYDMSSQPNPGRIRRAARLGIVGACLVLSAPMSAQEPKPQSTLEGHSEPIKTLSFSPDGKTLASSDDHAVKLWEVATGRCTATLEEKRPYLWGTVAFSPDGKTLATGGWFNKVKLWDVGNLKGTLILDEDLQCPPGPLVFSPDGKTLASGGVCRSKMRLFDAATGKSIATLVPHKGVNPEGVIAMAFTPDNKTLISLACPGEIKLWDVATDKCTDTLEITGRIHYAEFTRDAKQLATADEASIKIWETTTGKEQAVLKGHTAEVLSVAFSRDGKLVASGDETGTIKLWDAVKDKELVTLKGHTGGVSSLAFNADGKMLASGGADKTIKLWEVPKTK